MFEMTVLVIRSAALKAPVFSIIIQVFMVHSCLNTKPQLHIHMPPKKGQFPVANPIPQILQMRRIYRGNYTVARRYEFYVRVARTISRTSEILFLLREHKIHIFEPTCNVLFIIWRNQFNKSKRRESWRHWTIRHSQRWHTENTPLGSRMKWRMESTSGLVPGKTLSSI